MLLYSTVTRYHIKLIFLVLYFCYAPPLSFLSYRFFLLIFLYIEDIILLRSVCVIYRAGESFVIETEVFFLQVTKESVNKWQKR